MGYKSTGDVHRWVFSRMNAAKLPFSSQNDTTILSLYTVPAQRYGVIILLIYRVPKS